VSPGVSPLCPGRELDVALRAGLGAEEIVAAVDMIRVRGRADRTVPRDERRAPCGRAGCID